VAGECGVAFGLTGPAFSVGAGLHAGVEALAAAYALVRAGDASSMLVVAVDDVEAVAGAWSAALGATLVPGAVALLVTRDRVAPSVARVASAQTTLRPTSTSTSSPSPVGHLALAPLASDLPPTHVTAASTLLSTHASATVSFLALPPN
jgi:3-oxoacyl-[acyl-carrier-protein] synthase III